MAEFSYNNSMQESLRTSPFYSNYGYHPRFDPRIPTGSQVPRAENYTKNLQELHQELKNNLEHSADYQKKFADRSRLDNPGFKLGDLVMV